MLKQLTPRDPGAFGEGVGGLGGSQIKKKYG